MDTINRSGEDLLVLINDVLEMSKIEAGIAVLNDVNFDLYNLLDRLQQMFFLKARVKRLQLIFERSKTVPQYIHSDESKLRQILINLLGNAIKFTETGWINLRVGTEQRESEDIEKQSDTAAALQSSHPISDSSPVTLFFEIEDTGCGIAPTDLDCLFEPFV